MKKIFEVIGLISLVCFSFFYTEKISTVIRENDDLLKQIEQIEEQYRVEAIDAIIDGNTIIPGVSGSQIDVKSSYKKMKKVDTFNSNLLVYEDIKPKVSVNAVYDKYIISGNKNKKEVSLLFLVENKTNIDKVVSTLRKYDIKVTFYIDGNWFEQNNEKITNLIEDGNVIGNLGYNYQYNTSGVSWMNTIVTKIGNQNATYCYVETEDEETLNICKNNRSYTIKPKLVVDNNPLIAIKQNITNGSIISLKINNQLNNELPLIIEYIHSKDLKIVTLADLLNE